MEILEEKRRSKRAPYNSRLIVESFYKSGEKDTFKANTNISIINISKTGIGFTTGIELPINHYFNCKLEIDEDRTIFCVLKTVRVTKLNNSFQVGAEFVGLADIVGEYIDEYVEDVDV